MLDAILQAILGLMRPPLPDIRDDRDYIFDAATEAPTPLPSAVDLRPQCPAVYDQGLLGSCTGNAIAAAIEFERKKQGLAPDFILSRLFIWYNERYNEHNELKNVGATLRDGIKSVVALGACAEDLWPYDETKFNVRPPQPCYDTALKDKVIKYQRIDQKLDDLKGCLASGYPFVFGMTVYDSFFSTETTKTGTVSMPAPAEKVRGGHAVLAVGYDDTNNRFFVRNSWGEQFGMKGYFTLPYTYLAQTQPTLTFDFWTIRLMESPTS